MKNIKLRIKTYLLLIIIVFLSNSGSAINRLDDKNESEKYIKLKSYKETAIGGELDKEIFLKSGSSISLIKNNIYITDYENKRIVVFNN